MISILAFGQKRAPIPISILQLNKILPIEFHLGLRPLFPAEQRMQQYAPEHLHVAHCSAMSNMVCNVPTGAIPG
ncbi:hypothetical protein HanRHA438_Chr11g0510301 [Helianthus annuus]|nr:hypothetical protein HanRHA438_Chr11g0510301 [Helianthus annuus]